MRALLVVTCTLILEACSHKSIELAPVPDEYLHVAYRMGATPLCAPERPLSNYLPGTGGDQVIVGRGANILLFDVGDFVDGPTIDNHDRLIINGVHPDQVHLRRDGHSLMLCAPEKAFAVTVMRQYCVQETKPSMWNNQIEEITFASGETWLADHLFEKLADKARIVNAKSLAKYRIQKVTDKEIENWSVYAFSEKLPKPENAANKCYEDQLDMQDRGYDLTDVKTGDPSKRNPDE